MTPSNDPIKQSPIHSLAEKLGGRLVTTNGWRVPHVYTSIAAEQDQARTGVVLADASANGKIILEGARTGDFLHGLWQVPNLEIGAGYPSEERVVFRLRSDLFFVSTSPGEVTSCTSTLQRAVSATGDFIGLTDVTHGLAEIWLVGPKSPELLSRLCGLDFRPHRFANQTARYSSVAKTRQLILRVDLEKIPAFALIGGRSLGAYLWETISRAGQDLNIAPIGLGALNSLRGA